MALLDQFSPPGNLDELTAAARAAWSGYLSDEIEPFASSLPQFFDPLGAEGPAPTRHPVTWPAFPSSLIVDGPVEELFEAADDRGAQDEYCEWAVTRDEGTIVRITFTTETPDYFREVLAHDEDLGLAIYASVAGRPVTVAELRDSTGAFDPGNAVNQADDGTIVHLSQPSNNLHAAVALAGPATVLREKRGEIVTDPPTLVDCGRLGESSRNSDPQIASAINKLAARGREISLADPAGLYLDGFLGGGIIAPDGADVGDFWRPADRGDADHVMRAVFEVPPDRDYGIEDLVVDGRPVRSGSQLARRVRVRLTAISRPGDHTPDPQPCIG